MENLPPPGSHSMSQGGLSSKCPGARSFRMAGMPSCAASTPTHGVSRGAHCGPCSPLDGLSCGSWSCLCMPTVGASCSSNPGSPKPSGGGGSGSVSSLHHAVLSALGSNASGSAVVASSALPASSMLVVPSVEAGAVFMSNDTPPGSCASMGVHSMGSTPAFPATWTGPRSTPPASSRGSSH